MKWLRSSILLLLAAIACRGAEPNPADLIRRAIAAEEENTRRAGNYTFLQRTDHREFGPNGEIKLRKIRTHDVTVLKGASYRRLVERDDRPLPPEEEKLEQDRLRLNIEAHRHETDAQRAKRIAEEDKRFGRSRAMVNEIPDAFDFRLRGEELIDARPAYVIDAVPRGGYRGKTPEARMILPKVKATVWIDKADLNWVRLEAESLDTISYAWLIVRVAKGARIRIDQSRINNEVWLPRKLEMSGAARIGLFKKFNAVQEMTFRNYRKFQTDAELVQAPGN